MASLGFIVSMKCAAGHSGGFQNNFRSAWLFFFNGHFTGPSNKFLTVTSLHLLTIQKQTAVNLALLGA